MDSRSPSDSPSVQLISPDYKLSQITLPTHDLCCERAGSAPPSGVQQQGAAFAALLSRVHRRKAGQKVV